MKNLSASLLTTGFLTFIGALILALTLLSSNSSASGSHFQGAHKMDPEKMLSMLDKKLKLTEEQRTEIGKVIDQYSPQLRKLMAKMKDDRKVGIGLIKKEVFDEDAVQKHADNVSEIMSKMIVIKLRIGNKIHSYLTPAQSSQLEKMFEEHHSRAF